VPIKDDLMVTAKHTFPEGFLWGTSTSSHQVEGGNRNNDWWEWEQQPGNIVKGHTSEIACGWWNGKWEEDLDRAQSGGQNAHRLSIEWSRIEPRPGEWDEEAIGYYREIMQGAVDRDLKLVVTLHHFTSPIWLTEKGGWANPEVVSFFERYARKTVNIFKDLADIWVTINEPNVFTFYGYLEGIFPPGKQDFKEAMQVVENLVRAHASAYHAIHEVQSNANVGLAHYYRAMEPARSWNPLDRFVTGIRHRTFNTIFPRAVQDGIIRIPGRKIRVQGAARTQDYFGLDYYTKEWVCFDPFRPKELFSRGYFPEDATLSTTGFLMDAPDGFWEALRYAKSFNLPVYIMENGVEDASDRMRPQYLARHIRKVWEAINFNWDIRGYFYWTLVDNFEWERGWTQRFGLWDLDIETQERSKRSSADFYLEICEERALSSEMVARYAPEIFEEMFPGSGPRELTLPK
jgi:beta-glucosidase